ncbi:MAG: hypothetical protein CL846_04360 [Crocinitomicaceae bacterium]|nr:hypothetical protein [Crocinitomicaceae bacterium]
MKKNKIIYIVIFSILFSCKNDLTNNKVDKDSKIIDINEHASKTPVQKTDTLDSLIILFFPNADKDSLIASVDSAIYLFFNDVEIPSHDELRKIEQDKNKVLKSIDSIKNSWPEELGDASDYYQYHCPISDYYERLSELSFGKEKEAALRSVLYYSDCLLDDVGEFLVNHNVLCELLKLQIHQQYPMKKTLKDVSELYLNLDREYYSIMGPELIYLKRLLDLYYSGELNKNIIPGDSTSDEKASISDTIISSEVQFISEERTKLSNLLSESSIIKMEHALKTLYSTDKDWEVIQSFIELAAIKDSLNILAKDEDEEFGIESISLEKSGIGFKNCHLYSYYQCGFTISFNMYSDRASATSGKADDDFFDFLSAHSEGALHDNDKFGAWMAGADFYRTWFLGKGAFLNYFKKETSLVKKHKIYNEEFNELSTEHIKDLKKIIEKIHDDAIDYIFYDPRKEDDMGICCNKNEVIEELNQILAANVLTESENKKLKIHVENLSNDNSPWLQWSFDNE